jgi:hypothetical protein
MVKHRNGSHSAIEKDIAVIKANIANMAQDITDLKATTAAHASSALTFQNEVREHLPALKKESQINFTLIMVIIVALIGLSIKVIAG